MNSCFCYYGWVDDLHDIQSWCISLFIVLYWCLFQQRKKTEKIRERERERELFYVMQSVCELQGWCYSVKLHLFTKVCTQRWPVKAIAGCDRWWIVLIFSRHENTVIGVSAKKAVGGWFLSENIHMNVRTKALQQNTKEMISVSYAACHWCSCSGGVCNG